MRTALSIISVLGAVSLASCGDDTQPAGTGGMGGAAGMAGQSGAGGTGGTGGIDAPMIDAAVDALAPPGPDASAAACTDYCDCMVNGNCQGSANGFTNLGACQATCVNLSASQVTCRTQQCNQAQDQGSAECQHAVGMGAGAPAACL